MTDFPPPTATDFHPSSPIAQNAISGPLTLGTLIDRAFRLYRNHFGLLLITAAVFLVPLGIATGILTGSFMTGYLGMLDTMINMLDSPSSEPEFDEVMSLFAPFAGFMGIYILLGIVGLVLQGIVNLALTAHALAILRGNVLTVRESISLAWSRLPAFIGKSILQGLAIFGATLGILLFFGCAIVLLIFTLGGSAGLIDGGFFEPTGPSSVIAFAGFFVIFMCLYLVAILMMLIPTFYFSARYMTATVGLVDQNWGAVESLRKSWALTKGRTWRCIGYFLLLGVLTLIIINMPIAIAQNLVQLFVGMEMLGPITGIFAAATSLMAVLWTPFQVAAMVLFYFDLRVRQENYDLELRLEQLEGSSVG